MKGESELPQHMNHPPMTPDHLARARDKKNCPGLVIEKKYSAPPI